MKRPIAGIAAGFVLGEVLVLQMQEAVNVWLTVALLIPALFCAVLKWGTAKERRTGRSGIKKKLLSVFLQRHHRPAQRVSAKRLRFAARPHGTASHRGAGR